MEICETCGYRYLRPYMAAAKTGFHKHHTGRLCTQPRPASAAAEGAGSGSGSGDSGSASSAGAAAAKAEDVGAAGAGSSGAGGLCEGKLRDTIVHRGERVDGWVINEAKQHAAAADVALVRRSLVWCDCSFAELWRRCLARA